MIVVLPLQQLELELAQSELVWQPKDEVGPKPLPGTQHVICPLQVPPLQTEQVFEATI